MPAKVEDQAEADLRSELKANEMTLMPICQEKPSLIDALASIIGLESERLHEKICGQIRQCLEENTLPRKLSYMQGDASLFEDYRKYPYLVNFAKITLEIASLIYETKITVYSQTQQGFLTGLIVNEKGYQQEIKLARIHNHYYEVKDSNMYHCGAISASSSSFSCVERNSRPPLNADYEDKGQLFNSENLFSSDQSGPVEPNFQLKGSMKNISTRDTRKLAAKHPERSEDLAAVLQSPILHKSKSLIETDHRKKNFEETWMKSSISPEMHELEQEEEQTVDREQIHPQDPNPIEAQHQGNTEEDHEALNANQEREVQKLFEKFEQTQEPQVETENIFSSGQTVGEGKFTEGEEALLYEYTPNEQQYQYYGEYKNMYGYTQYYPDYYYQQHQPYLYRHHSSKEAYHYDYHSMQSPPKMSSSRRQNSVAPNMSTLEIKENERYTGKLKFFDEAKNYGFIIMDADNRDIFVHCDDLQKAGISKERVKSYKQSQGSIQFSFKVMEYFGKYDKSRKAVDLTIIEDDLMPGLYSENRVP